jgi:hypothetical protein
MSTKVQLRSVRSLPEGPLLLLGRLAIRRVRSGPDKSKPFPVVIVWSPWSRQMIEVDVPGETMGLEATFETFFPDFGDTLNVGLDPANRSADRMTLSDLKASLRRWSVQMSLAKGIPVDRLMAERTLSGSES